MYNKHQPGYSEKSSGQVTMTVGRSRLDPPLEKSPLGPDHDIVMEMWGQKTTRKEYMFLQQWAESLKNM